MKSEFKARPVYLSRDDRIIAHFTTCFISLVIYRLLEKKLNGKYTCHEIINGLRDINFLEVKGEGYVPAYTRTDFTDDIHEAFGFRTDYQIVSKNQMKKILRYTKSLIYTHFLMRKQKLGFLYFQGFPSFFIPSTVKYGYIVCH